MPCSRRNSTCSISRPEVSEAFSSATKEGPDYLYAFSCHSQKFRPSRCSYRLHNIDLELSDPNHKLQFLIFENYPLGIINQHFNVILWRTGYVLCRALIHRIVSMVAIECLSKTVLMIYIHQFCKLLTNEHRQ